MDKDYFAIRISNRTFEYSASHGYVDSGGKPEDICIRFYVELIPWEE